MTEGRSRGVTTAHVRWLELQLQDAIGLIRDARDGLAGRGDLGDFLESTRGFTVGECDEHIRRETT